MDIRAVREMTEQDLQDLHSIARAVHRLEQAVVRQDAQLERLERFADRAEGAMTVIKLGVSLLGVGGIATIIAVFARSGP